MKIIDAATVTAYVSILFLSVIQMTVELLIYSIQLRLFQICLHHFHAMSRFVYNPTPGCTLENQN